jgi:hypothetical protein
VQCKRGQPKPPGTVLVRRPYRFGNPFDWRIYGHRKAVELFAGWIVDPDSTPIRCGKKTYRPSTFAEIRERLGGADLGCNCDLDQPCHADILLRLANE